MYTIISNKIYITNPSSSLLLWCDLNLVVTNPLWETLTRLGKQDQIYRKHIPQKMYLYVRKGEGIILPFGVLNSVWNFIKDSPYKIDFNNAGDISCKNDKIVQPLYDYQEKAVQEMLKAKGGILVGGCGSGKGLPLDTLIATPNGWIKNGDLKVGDLILGKNGKPTKVIGIFDRGIQPCYKIIFNDGNEVVCDSSHLWNIQTNKHRLLQDNKFKTVDTETLFKTLHKKRDNNGFIPMIEPVEYEHKEIALDAWILGALLGDGTFSKTNNVSITNSEDDIIEKIEKYFGKENITILKSGNTKTTIIKTAKTDIKNKIKSLGLYDKKSCEKFIPNLYKYNSIDVRLAIVQGLFDTDGNVSKSKFEYSTTSLQLAKDFKEIIESLGGICKLKERKTSYTYKGIKKYGKINYRLMFFINNKILPFTSKKHTEKFKERKTYRSAYRIIKKIIPVESQQTRCIKVDAEDSLYAIKNYIITHNTNCGIEIVHRIGKKFLFLVHTKDLLKQALARFKFLYPNMDVGTITEGKINMGKDGTIATIQTMANLDPELYKHEFDVVMTDECHHAVNSPTLLKMFGKVIEQIPARYKFGLTATPSRGDTLIKSMYTTVGTNTKGLFEPVYQIDKSVIKTLTAKHIKVELDTPFSYSMLNEDGSFNYPNLIDYLSTETSRNNAIIDNVVQLAKSGRKQLILCHRVEQAKMLQEQLSKELNAKLLVGSVTSKKREEILTEKTPWDVIVATYSLAKEGLDLPCLDTLHMITPQKDKAMVVQCVGRIERIKEGKKEPEVYDYVDMKIPYCTGAFKKRKNYIEKRY